MIMRYLDPSGCCFLSRSLFALSEHLGEVGKRLFGKTKAGNNSSSVSHVNYIRLMIRKSSITLMTLDYGNYGIFLG